jgi:starch-binding outer membrane protein, SusD/RagB family
MTMIASRARWGFTASVSAAAFMVMSGCNLKQDLLSPQQPQVIGPASAATQVGAEALRVGAVGALSCATGGATSLWAAAGTLADEWKSSDTFFQTDQEDQRSVPNDNSQVAGNYSTTQTARGAAMIAMAALRQFASTPPAELAQMYFALGYLEMDLSEDFCNGVPFGYSVNGVPVYVAGSTNAQGFALAKARFDSGLALVGTATDSFSVNVRNGLLLSEARVLVDLGQFTAAIANTANIATSYTYNLTFAITSGDNGPWTMNGTQSTSRYTVSDSFYFQGGVTQVIANALPFASAKDPRVPVTGGTSGTKYGTDGITPWVGQLIWVGRSDPVPLATGIDARLIEAEAKLQNSDINGMMTILNALRASPQLLGNLHVPAMAPLPTPASQSAAVALLFRERGFWQFGRGQRLGHLRRMIRQYNLTQDKVFPTGPYPKGGVFGTDVNLPVTTNENTNPNFKGCIDRNA